MRYRVAALIPTVLATAAAVLMGAGPAVAAPGVSVQITNAPARFTAGGNAGSVTVVVSTDNKLCRKVRWSMVLTVDGLDLDQVRVDRREGDTSFPVKIDTQGNAARITDVDPDPGTLCRGSTVTANYAVQFTGGAGKVTFLAQALDPKNDKELGSVTGTSTVAGQEKATPPPAETTPPAQDQPSPDPSASDGGGVAAGDYGSADPAPTTKAPAAAAAGPQTPASKSGTLSVLGPGLIVGALLVFLGVGILLRLRSRNRRRTPPNPQNFAPTGFY